MYGISSGGKEAIAIAVEKMFDSLAYKLLGNIPKLREKSPFFGTTPILSLAHIFIEALGGTEPNQLEKDVLKGILNSSYGYIESLKNKTSSTITEAVDGLVKESKLKNVEINAADVADIIALEMTKAKSHMKLIAEAETTKTRNTGHLLDITSKAQDVGDMDPTCFFIVVRDKLLCLTCKKLHMLEDGITPRVWKMSELGMQWHKRDENFPSALGEHPHCRCTLSQLPKGWGFKNGFVSFISLDWDEWKSQRGMD